MQFDASLMMSSPVKYVSINAHSYLGQSCFARAKVTCSILKLFVLYWKNIGMVNFEIDVVIIFTVFEGTDLIIVQLFFCINKNSVCCEIIDFAQVAANHLAFAELYFDSVF